MHIEIDLFERDFRWLWLMYVTGFDERYHCQQCLKGRKSRILRYDQGTIALPSHFAFDLDEFRAPYVYLCGVTARYEENLHIAARPSPGNTVTYADNRIRVVVSDAEQVPILPVDADKPAQFLRCRNFQFGYRYLRPFPERQTMLFEDTGHERSVSD